MRPISFIMGVPKWGATVVTWRPSLHPHATLLVPKELRYLNSGGVATRLSEVSFARLLHDDISRAFCRKLERKFDGGLRLLELCPGRDPAPWREAASAQR